MEGNPNLQHYYQVASFTTDSEGDSVTDSEGVRYNCKVLDSYNVPTFQPLFKFTYCINLRKSFPNLLYMVHVFMDTLVFDAGSVSIQSLMYRGHFSKCLSNFLVLYWTLFQVQRKNIFPFPCLARARLTVAVLQASMGF